VLVTAQHAVQMQWNELALRSHCRRTANMLYRFHAEDMTEGCPLRLKERWAVARHVFKDNSHTARLKRQGGLQKVIELALGCKVIITMNLDTDMDIANGVRGQIMEMWADPQEESGTMHSVQEMKYPPTCILVKLERFHGHEIEDLGEGTIPIFPIQ
jgi:hypothetical protein